MSGTSPPNGSGKRGKGKYQQLYDSGALPLPQSPRRIVTVTNVEGQESRIYEDQLAEYNEFLNSIPPEELEALRAFATANAAARDAVAARAEAARVSPTPVLTGEPEDPFLSDSDTPDVNATFTLTAPGTATFRVRLSPSRRTGERRVAPVEAQARLRSRAQARRAREVSIDTWQAHRRRLLEEARRFEAFDEPERNARLAAAEAAADHADELAESEGGDQPAKPHESGKRGQKRQRN